jgi:hypothetical protein
VRYVEQVQHTLNFVVDWTFTLRTLGGRRSDGRILSPAPRSYIFTARLWSTRFVPGIFKFHQRSFPWCKQKMTGHTISHSKRLFSRSRLYLSNRGHMSIHVPTMFIASSSRLGTRGSSILPSAMAVFFSISRAFTN